MRLQPRQLASLSAPSASDVLPVDSVSSESTLPSSTSDSSTSISTGVSSETSTTSSTVTSESISLTFGVPLPTVSPGSETGSPPFHLVYLIPVIVVVGAVALIFIIWSIQGCCNRKSRKLPFRESLYEDLEKAEPSALLGRGGSKTTGRTSSIALRRPAPSSPASFIASGPYESRDKSTPPWAASVQGQKQWTDSLEAVAGSAFVNPNAESPTSRARHHRGVTLRDEGPTPLTPDFARRFKSTADLDWIIEASKRRQRTNSSKSIYSQSSSVGQYTGSKKQGKPLASTNPISLHRRSPEHIPDLTEDPSSWSPQTGFRIVQESPPPMMQITTSSGTPRSPPSPLLHASFQGTPSDELTNSTALHSPPDSTTHGYGYYGGLSGQGRRFLSPSNNTPRLETRAISKDTRVAFLSISPAQIMSPPMHGELCFMPVSLGALGDSSEALIHHARSKSLKFRSKDKETQLGLGTKEHPRSISTSTFLDRPLPNPRSRVRESMEGEAESHSDTASAVKGGLSGGGGEAFRTRTLDGVDIIRLDPRRRTLLRKPSMLMGFRYERVARDE